jgi:hypothetical protein
MTTTSALETEFSSHTKESSKRWDGIPTCFSYKIKYKCIRANRYTDTNKTFRAKGVKDNFLPEVSQCGTDSNDVVHYIEHNLLCNTMHRENDCLIDIELQVSIFFENDLTLS